MSKSIHVTRAFSPNGKDDPTSPLRSFGFYDNDKTPSWRTGGDGYAALELRSHVGNRYLSITARESSKDNGRTKGVCREVMMSMDEPQGRALLEWLQQLYGEQS